MVKTREQQTSMVTPLIDGIRDFKLLVQFPVPNQAEVLPICYRGVELAHTNYKIQTVKSQHFFENTVLSSGQTY